MSSTAHRTDVAIIGAGPVGMFAVFQCGMLKLSCHVVDALDALGGQLTALYPEKPIYDIPGYPAILAGELVQKLEEQAAPFDPTYHLGQRVIGLTRSADERWLVETDTGTQIDAKVVILAAGAGAFGPNRPPIEGLADFEGRSIFYLVARREDFRDKKVVIAGGGDSAVDWAVSLAELATSVQVIHRRPKFRAAPGSVKKMDALVEAGKIELVIPYQLAGLEGDGGQLSTVIVRDLDKNERRLDADVLLPFYGLAMDLGPIAGWGLTLEQNHVVVDPSTCETNQPGIFAVGDIATYAKKIKLILCGFSEVAMAAHAAYAIVHPDEALHFEYSTSKGVPAE